LADPKLWEYVTGRENPTEAAHSLFLNLMFLLRVLLFVVNAVISVAEFFRGFDGWELRVKPQIESFARTFSRKIMVRVPIVKQRGATIDLNSASEKIGIFNAELHLLPHAESDISTQSWIPDFIILMINLKVSCIMGY